MQILYHLESLAGNEFDADCILSTVIITLLFIVVLFIAVIIVRCANCRINSLLRRICSNDEITRNRIIIYAAFLSVLFLLLVYYWKVLPEFPESTLTVLMAVPVAWVLWIWRNHDKTTSLNIEVSRNIYDRFISLCELAEDKKKNEGIRSAAIIALSPYLKGEHGDKFQVMADAFFKTLSHQLIVYIPPQDNGAVAGNVKKECPACCNALETVFVDMIKGKWLDEIFGYEFSGMNFSSIELKSNFSKCHFYKTKFTECKARGLSFDLCDFDEAVFDGCDFSTSSFSASFRRCIFGRGTVFSQAQFLLPTFFENAAFPCADFSNSTFAATTSFEKCNFENVDFSHATWLYRCNFENAHFSVKSDMSDTTYGSGCNFNNIEFCSNIECDTKIYPFFARTVFYNPCGSINSDQHDFSAKISANNALIKYGIEYADDGEAEDFEEIRSQAEMFAKDLGCQAQSGDIPDHLKKK